MAGPGVGVNADVYDDVLARVSPLVTAETLTSTELIATYLLNDLYKVVIEASINLPETLNIPPEYGEDPKELVGLICDDVERMMLDRLIDGAEILLTDPAPKPAANGAQEYKVRYRVRYIIENGRTLDPTELGRWGGDLKTLASTFHNARLTFGVKFRVGVPIESRRKVKKPYYHFDWAPEVMNYDGRDLVSFHVAGLRLADQRVQRITFTSAATLKNPLNTP